MIKDSEITTREARIPLQKEVIYRGESFRSYELPVNPKNRATYVVPVYREFGEGNVVNLLENLSLQDIPKDEMEVILLINNKKSDASRQSDAYQDNQRTLQVLRAVQEGSELPSELSVEEKSILRKVIDSGLRINYVDMSSQGVSEVVIGDIRNAGNSMVSRRSEETFKNKDNAVFHFDADTNVGGGHTQAVLAEIDKGVDMVVTNWEWKVPDNAPDRIFLDRNYCTFLDAYGLTEKAIKGFGIVVGTPRMTSRLRTLESTNGFPSVTTGEDYGLIKRVTALASQGEAVIKVVPDLFVHTAFRERHDNPPNFDSKLIAEMDSSGSHEPFLKGVNNFWHEWLVGKIISMQRDSTDELPARFREYVEKQLFYPPDRIENVNFDGLENLDVKDIEKLKIWVDELLDGLDIMPKSPLFTLPNALVTILRSELPEEEFEEYKDLAEKIMKRNSSDIDREEPMIADDVRFGVRFLVGADDADYIGTYLYNAVYFQAFNLMSLQAVVSNKLPGFKKVHDTFRQVGNVYEVEDK